jgi:hypothetical protein
MNWEGAVSGSEVISFGPYRLIPAERLLLKEGEVVNVGNRALDILVALAETAGEKKAVAIAVRNISGRRRWSKLHEWLRPGPSLSRSIGMAV